MAEILREWLSERLKRPIQWEPENFGQMMKDGFIIGNVLLSYLVINEESFYLLRSTTTRDEINTNWKYLRQWLKEVEVNVSDADLINITEGHGSTLLRLFYQLFLHLDKRDRTNFIKEERKAASTLVEKLGHRFNVEKVNEIGEPAFDDLSMPLVNEKHFIEWQRKKAKEVKDTYDYMRHMYTKMIAKVEEKNTLPIFETSKEAKNNTKMKEDIERFALRHPCRYQNYTYDELLDLEQKASERKSSLLELEWTKNYLENLNTKLNKKCKSDEFHKQIRNTISGSLWNMSIAEEETKLDTELAKKVMKLSQFEKQMCTQIMETKQQARNLIQNRIQAEREFSEQREQYFNNFLDNVKEQIHLEVEEIDFEKQRQQLLHKKLYAEKTKRKRQHFYEICYDTILSIVDFATKYAYYRKIMENNIPEHFVREWKALYFKHQPIFDILDPMEDILKEPLIEEEHEPKEEEIIRLELDRQQALNDYEFEEYHNYCGPWTLENLIPNYDPNNEERKTENLGLRILGHLVFTLLEIKYPFPPAREPADLPSFPAKVLLRGLPDRSITTSMQSLLNLRKIHIVRLESAINFCLREYKTEMIGCTDIDVAYDKFIGVAQEDESKEILKLMKYEDEILSKSIETISTSTTIPPNAKQTQTPKTIPEEEIKLSPAAELGQYAFESLSFGEPLTDYLLASIIVAYLKHQKDINGFVIINYPNTYREAQIIEETFSGRTPPDEEEIAGKDDIYLEESIANHVKQERDAYKDIRLSRLVMDPHKKRIPKPFESYFTCYIRLQETEDILQEEVIWNLNEENSELIDRFYSALGINYSMYYEVMDKDFLAQMCKYIIGDASFPGKSCESLFGPGILSQLEFPSSGDKRLKSKTVKPEISLTGKSKDKLKNSSKLSKSNSSQDQKKELTVVKVSDISVTVSKTMKEVISEKNDNIEEVIYLAGETEWDYGEIPIPEPIGVSLASCWEQVEKTYIHDMEQLFLSKRLQMNSLVPYSRFLKDKMEQIITLPSGKQDLVVDFQKKYNEFENDWRDYNATKNEWHCRIKELQIKLYEICDQRKRFAEQQRYALISENWAMEELTSMVNTYISCMQTELNRYFLTMQAFHDFYFTMIKRLPPTDRLSSKDLTKVHRDYDETAGGKKSEDKVYKQLKASFIDMQLKNISIDYSNNPFNMIIENNVKLALKTVKDVNDSYKSLIGREVIEISKSVPQAKKKDENSSELSVSPEEIFRINALKCIEEWKMGINGEMCRVILRIIALQFKCFQDMKLFNDHIYKTFMDIQNYINSYYTNEIKSVDRLCKYLQMAVEHGRKISESLILDQDEFVIDPNLLQFSFSKSDLIKEVAENVQDMEFYISQLARLRAQFKICGPTGILLQQSFIYLVQDFIFYGKETCEGPLFPETWKRIDPEQVPKFVHLLFGETVYVDWRDFLIYCMNIQFPSMDELLHMRHSFRCNDQAATELIHRDFFIKEKLWFEDQFDLEDKSAQLRKTLIKHFLFELFETSTDMMNYSAFLLALSKSIDPIEGFAKALTMAVGKKICFQLEECEEVVCKLINEKRYRDACLVCAHKCTTLFLDNVIDKVITICEGTTIEELAYVEPPPEEKKGKRSKGTETKNKKAESAREAKSRVQPDKGKTSQSAVDVKATYICKPCEEEAASAEVLHPEKVEVEEAVDLLETLQDPNIVYAVSQSVILNVLRISLPWHFQTNADTSHKLIVYNTISRLQTLTDNGDIYVCKFVAEPDICKLLNKVKKFTAINLFEEVRKVLKN